HSSGTLTLERNSTLAATRTVSFSGCSLNITASYNTYTLSLHDALPIFNSNAAPSNVTLSGGGLGGSGTVTVSGTLNWTGGAMGGGGTTVIASGATLAVSGPNIKTFGPRTLNNSGTMSLSGAEVRFGQRSGVEQPELRASGLSARPAVLQCVWGCGGVQQRGHGAQERRHGDYDDRND